MTRNTPWKRFKQIFLEDLSLFPEKTWLFLYLKAFPSLHYSYHISVTPQLPGVRSLFMSKLYFLHSLTIEKIISFSVALSSHALFFFFFFFCGTNFQTWVQWQYVPYSDYCNENVWSSSVLVPMLSTCLGSHSSSILLTGTYNLHCNFYL